MFYYKRIIHTYGLSQRQLVLITELLYRGNFKLYFVDTLYTLIMGINLLNNGNIVIYLYNNFHNDIFLFFIALVSKSKLREDINARWSTLMPDLMALLWSTTPDHLSELFNKVMNFYMKNGNFIDKDNPNNIQNFVDVSIRHEIQFLIFVSFVTFLKSLNQILN